MKRDIHPQWFPQAQVSCACGNKFTVGATKATISLDICSHCHPFFTGEMRYVDTMGRVEKFQRKQQNAAAMQSKLADKKKKKKEREDQLRTSKSLKEMLMGMK